MTTTVLLVRHGETEAAREDRFNGRSDVPLNLHGIKQAERLASSLKQTNIEACYSSPLSRCMETAQLIVGMRPLQIQISPSLIESDYGDWEQLPREEISLKYADAWKRWTMDPAGIAPPNGESGYQIAARVLPFFWEVVQRWEGKTILMVAHKAVNRILLAHLLGIPIRDYRKRLAQFPSALNQIEVHASGDAQIVLLNDVSHVSEAE